MSFSNCSRAVGLLLVGALGLVCVVAAQERPPICEQIARSYGLSSFQQVEQIRYTFNVDLGQIKLNRSWVWEPKTDRVSYESKDKDGKTVKYTYLRSQISSQPTEVGKEIDPAFVNDQYWLLFPLHLSWDKDAKVEDKGIQRMPGGKETARRILVSYPSQGGYTPGDMYELFVGGDNQIRAWVYHRGGSQKPTVTASWGDYKKVGPLLVSLDHRGTKDDGKPIHIFFTNVAVKVASSNAWVSAQ
jgi:hypothetical protein